jgi:hypothetical protein
VVEILEQGAISFLAAPDRDGRRSPERLWVVLAPAGSRVLRRLAVRRRRLPDPARGQRFFAHLDRVAATAAHLTEDLRDGRPRGRLVAQVAAVGRYALARHGDHVHLSWALARACGRGPLASSMGIAASGAWVVCVFSRSLPPGRNVAAATPLAAATPDALDVLGAEVALVAGSRPRDAALGIAAPAADRVGDALAGALLRRWPSRPRRRWLRVAPA